MVLHRVMLYGLKACYINSLIFDIDLPSILFQRIKFQVKNRFIWNLGLSALFYGRALIYLDT
jgi:hypothetical protein